MAVSAPRKRAIPATETDEEPIVAPEVVQPEPVGPEVVEPEPVGPEVAETGIRISDAAKRAGVSARTLRYYEELGLLAPSLYTPGGERRYTLEDLGHLERILELREVLGMNLDEIREFLALETRLDELRVAYRATRGATSEKARAAQKATLQEALELNESLAKQLADKLARMDAFRAKLAGDARRCRELLSELD
jgi:DNA-binding transcriptional MerR regulator